MVASNLVVRDQNADRALARAQWDVETRAGAKSPGDLLVHFGILEQRIDALAAPAPHHARRLRVGFEHPDRSERVRSHAVGCGDPQALSGGQRDRDETGADELAEPDDD